jgi:hypothetical protein
MMKDEEKHEGMGSYILDRAYDYSNHMGITNRDTLGVMIAVCCAMAAAFTVEDGEYDAVKVGLVDALSKGMDAAMEAKKNV